MLIFTIILVFVDILSYIFVEITVVDKNVSVEGLKLFPCLAFYLPLGRLMKKFFSQFYGGLCFFIRYTIVTIYRGVHVKLTNFRGGQGFAGNPNCVFVTEGTSLYVSLC